MSELIDELVQATRAEGVPSALAAARDSVDTLLRDRGHRRTTAQHTGEALLRGAVASARIDGSTTTREQLEAGEGDPTAVGAARLAAELLSLVEVADRAPLQAIARMHTLAAAGTVDVDQLGRPRPGGAGVVQRVAGLLGTDTDVPAIAVAAAVHAEIVVGAPFVTANGVVGRGLERLVLVSRGVDPAAVTVPEAGYLDLDDRRRAALETYDAQGPAGRQRWILTAAEAVVAGVSHSPLADE